MMLDYNADLSTLIGCFDIGDKIVYQESKGEDADSKLKLLVKV